MGLPRLAARRSGRDHARGRADLAPHGRLDLDAHHVRRLRRRARRVLRLWAADPADREQVSTAYTWLESGDFEVQLGILLDTLSSTMMLVVSGVGGLIVWYSMGYMAGDDEERRYFAYMSLFVFSMLLLVQAGNFLPLLVGWGLVGLASYLLIGFWHHRPEAVAAAKKAFVMNAIGDATIALAIVLMIWYANGQLGFLGVFTLVEDGSSAISNSTPINLIALGLLGGAIAKSAQIPLHLAPGRDGGPDARLRAHPRGDDGDGGRLPARPRSPIFEAAPDVQHLAAILGALTSSWRVSSRSCSGTSSASSPTRRCRRSATCSSPRGSARTATRSST